MVEEPTPNPAPAPTLPGASPTTPPATTVARRSPRERQAVGHQHDLGPALDARHHHAGHRRSIPAPREVGTGEREPRNAIAHPRDTARLQPHAFGQEAGLVDRDGDAGEVRHAVARRRDRAAIGLQVDLDIGHAIQAQQAVADGLDARQSFEAERLDPDRLQAVAAHGDGRRQRGPAGGGEQQRKGERAAHRDGLRRAAI